MFADVSPDTGNLDPDAAKAALTPNTTVVAGVDYAGHPIDAAPLRSVAHDAGALLLEDAAHSVGGTWHGRPVGDLADLTTLSFFPTKNLTTAEGGAVVSPRPDLVAGARSFRNHGLVRDKDAQRFPDEGPWHQEVHAFGLNYRLPDLLAALGSSQLTRLAAFTARRREIHARYDAALADVPEVRTPVRRDGAEPAWHLYRCACSTAAAARCSSTCASTASGCRSTTSPPTGTRSSPTSATAAACARMPRSTTPSRSRCRCSPISPTPTSTGSRAWCGSSSGTRRERGVSAVDASREVLGRGSLYTLGSVAPILANVVVTPFVTRLLGDAEYGVVAVGLILVQVGAMVVGFGLASSITRHGILESSGTDGARALVLQGSALSLAVVVLAVLAGPWWSLPVLSVPWRAGLVFAGLAAAGFVVVLNAQAFLRVQDRPVPFVVMSGVATLGGPLAGLALVAWRASDADDYLFGLLLGYLAAAVIGLALALRGGRPHTARGDFGRALRIGLPAVPHLVALLLVQNALVLIVSRYFVADGGRMQIALLLGSAPP